MRFLHKLQLVIAVDGLKLIFFVAIRKLTVEETANLSGNGLTGPEKNTVLSRLLPIRSKLLDILTTLCYTAVSGWGMFRKMNKVFDLTRI